MYFTDFSDAFSTKMSIKIGIESGEHKKRKFIIELPKITNLI
jgi:hypothetical protein